MANPVTITLPIDPDTLTNAGMYGAGAKIRLQTASAAAGAFADVTGAGSTPTIPIVTATWSYQGFDPAGASTSWYRTRFEDTTGASRLSEWSEVFQAGATNSTAVGTYATLPGVKMRLNRLASDTADDELIQRYCDQVNSQMETRIGRVIAPLTGLQFVFDGFDAIGGRKLWVPMGIRTISLLEVAPATGGTFQTVTAAQVFLQPNVQDLPNGWPFLRIELSNLGGFFFMPGLGNIRATGTFGWAAIPDDLVDCGETTAVRAFQARRTGQGDIAGSDDLGRAIISRILAAEWRDVLSFYAVNRWAK